MSSLSAVVVENSADTVPASHAEVLQAVAASGKHVEAIVKAIVRDDVVGAYLREVPLLPEYDLKPKKEGASATPVPAAGGDKTDAILSTIALMTVFSVTGYLIYLRYKK